MIFKPIKSSTDGGRIETTLLDPMAVCMLCYGRIDEEFAALVAKDLSAVLTKHPEVRFYLVDTTETNHWTPNIRGQVVELLHLIKKHNIKEILAVIPSSALRMFAAAVTFAAGVPLKTFPTRDQAERHLRQQIKTIKK